LKHYTNPITVRDKHYVTIDEYTCWNCGINKKKEGIKVRAEPAFFIKLRDDGPPLEGRLFRCSGGAMPCGCGTPTVILWSDPVVRGDSTWLRLFDRSGGDGIAYFVK
jgi:hypothetical protein